MHLCTEWGPIFQRTNKHEAAYANCKSALPSKVRQILKQIVWKGPPRFQDLVQF